MASDAVVIYEATFSEDCIFAMANILVKNGNAFSFASVSVRMHTEVMAIKQIFNPKKVTMLYEKN